MAIPLSRGLGLGKVRPGLVVEIIEIGVLDEVGEVVTRVVSQSELLEFLIDRTAESVARVGERAVLEQFDDALDRVPGGAPDDRERGGFEDESALGVFLKLAAALVDRTKRTGQLRSSSVPRQVPTTVMSSRSTCFPT